MVPAGQTVITEPGQIFLAVDHHIDLRPPAEVADKIRRTFERVAGFGRPSENDAIECLCDPFRRCLTQPLVEKLVGFEHAQQLNARRNAAFRERVDQAAKNVRLRVAAEQIAIELSDHPFGLAALNLYRHRRLSAPPRNHRVHANSRLSTAGAPEGWAAGVAAAGSGVGRSAGGSPASTRHFAS